MRGGLASRSNLSKSGSDSSQTQELFSWGGKAPGPPYNESSARQWLLGMVPNQMFLWYLASPKT